METKISVSTKKREERRKGEEQYMKKIGEHVSNWMRYRNPLM